MLEGKNRNIVFDIGNVLLKFNPNANLQNSVSPIEENIKILAILAKTYQVFAITDASIDQIKFEMKTFNFYGKFVDVLISDECNLNKNTPGIYQYFLEKHNLKAEETVFSVIIGSSLSVTALILAAEISRSYTSARCIRISS